MLVIEDTTPFEDCADTINMLEAPGSDIGDIQLKAQGFGATKIAHPRPIRYHPIPSINDFANPDTIRRSNLELACSEFGPDDMLALTCGGSLVVGFESDERTPVYPAQNLNIRVLEYGNFCALSAPDRFSIGLCRETTAVLNGNYADDCSFVEYGGETPLSALFDDLL